MIQFFVGVFVGIAIVLIIAYILIVDPWAPPLQPQDEFVEQYRPVQIPEELRTFLKSGEDGQGISKWESCNSISLLLHMLFQEHKDTRALRRWVHKRLQMEMNDIATRSAAGRLIQEIRIRELSLGTKFMTINSIRVENVEMADDKNTFDKITFVIDIDYSGGFETSIDVATFISKRASLSVKITKLTGMIRVILSRQPYHHWTFSFVSPPIFETDINSQIQGHQLKRLIPIIKEAIRRSLQRKHVWPNYKIRYRPFFPNPIFQASPPINSLSHVKLEGGMEVTVLQCSRLKTSLVDEKVKSYEVYCTVSMDHRPLTQNEEHGHCVSVLLTFSRFDVSTPIGMVFDKTTTGTNNNRPVKVLTVEDNSLSDKAAFKPGDVLVAINNVPIRSERQATRFLQQTIGDLMVLVERSLDDIDEDDTKEDEEIIVSDVRDVDDGFEVVKKDLTDTSSLAATTSDEASMREVEAANEHLSTSQSIAEVVRRRHSVSNFESSVMDTNTESVNSSVFSLDAARFEKPAVASVQRAESARVPHLLVSQPSCDLRRTQSESRLDAKVIDAVMASTSDFAVEEEISQMFVGSLGRERNPMDGERLGVTRKDDKDRTLTQADAAKGLSMFQANTGSVASLSSMNSNKTDTEGDIGEEDETTSLTRKRQNSTRRAKIQATLAAGKRKVLDLMPQKRKENDICGESIEYAADAGELLCDDREKSPSQKRISPTEKKEKKKLKKKKLSDSPKTPSFSQSNNAAKTRSTKSVQFQKDVMWGQSLHFEMDRSQLKYLNVTVHAKEVKTPQSSTTPDSLTSQESSSTASTSKDVVLGTVSLYIPQLIDDCRLTLSNCHREVYQLKQANNLIEPPTTSSTQDPLTEFSRHAGFDPRLCFGDITLGFRFFPNGLPTGKALNSGEESDEEMVKVPETPAGRPFSPPALTPSNHDWKLWYGGKSSTVCAMCRGKIWLRNASCCSRCLVICHNKCVVKANQGGIACSPLQTSQNPSDSNFEELTLPEPEPAETPSTEILEELVMQSPPTLDTPDLSKRARFKKVTEKFSNWRKGGGSAKKKDEETDRMSQQSLASTWSNDSRQVDQVVEPRDSPMASIQDVLSDVLPCLDGSPFIHGLYFQPGNAYNEQTIRNAKTLGREIYSELPSDQRIEKINSQIDRIQTAIRETKDDRLSVMQNGGESSAKFQGLDERLQALAVLMLHYCSALQDCQSGRSTPAPPNFDDSITSKSSDDAVVEPDTESIMDEDTVVADLPPSRPDQLVSPT